MTENLPAIIEAPVIHRARGKAVILDSDLAAALGLETRALNQSIKRNATMIDDRHGFQLTQEEFNVLRSQSVMSKPGRGGRTHLPWVFTERGVTRVTTFINTPQAIRASDLIVDTFVMVQKQVAAGRQAIAVGDPSRYHVEPEVAEQNRELGKRMMTAISGLLDMVIDIRTRETVADTAKDMTARVLENVRERLREKSLENLKLEAEIQLILREAEKLAQDVEGKKLENLEKRIDLVQKLIAMHRDMQPSQLVQLLDAFDTPSPPAIASTRQLPRPMKSNP